MVLVAVFLTLSMIFTLVISGQVAAIVMIPLALAAAQAVGLDARPFAMAVAMGCSLAFLTPLGHPVNIMVMNPGGYSFRDYGESWLAPDRHCLCFDPVPHPHFLGTIITRHWKKNFLV